PLLHRYAGELAEADGTGQAGLRRRFVGWYLDQAETAQAELTGPTPERRDEAARWFAAELENLPEVMATANQLGLTEVVWRLPIACWPWLRRNRSWPGWLDTVHQLGLAAARAGKNPAAEALLLKNIGNTYRLQGRAALAETYLRQSLRLHTELDDGPGRAWT